VEFKRGSFFEKIPGLREAPVIIPWKKNSGRFFSAGLSFFQAAKIGFGLIFTAEIFYMRGHFIEEFVLNF